MLSKCFDTHAVLLVQKGDAFDHDSSLSVLIGAPCAFRPE
jgi:hypothetical protein